MSTTFPTLPVTRTNERVEAPTIAAVVAEFGQRLAVPSSRTLQGVLSTLDEHPDAVGVLIVDDGRLLGVLSRDSVATALSGQYARQLFLDKPLHRFLAWKQLVPLVLPPDTDISVAITLALDRETVVRYEPLVTMGADGEPCLLDVPRLLLSQCQALEQTVSQLEHQRLATLAAERDRERLHAQLVDASRDAGRADVATGILHNVGNVLNSMNVSRAAVSRMLEASKVGGLAKAVHLMSEHADDLGNFISCDPRGQLLPSYLGKLAETLAAERQALIDEVGELGQNIEHIKQVVATQQCYARALAVCQSVRPADLMDDAARMNLMSFERHNVTLDRRYDFEGTAWLDRHRVLQVLVNLISNAKNAVKQRGELDRRILLSVEPAGPDDPEDVVFVVQDNGVGIAAEHLTAIFAHGFTTRKDGHGFGLHSAANLAKEMGGRLTVASDGPGHGARFTLALPAMEPR